MTATRIHLTINGQTLAAEGGQTLLDVCRANGIDVPTLCHHEGLPDIGACRLCIVEIDGQRRPQPSCTTPAEDGQVVRTQSPVLQELRRKTLELIFGERNHICPFCPRSGNCELQSSAYSHHMDHVSYDYVYPRLPMDNSHPFIALDHNRCILCMRCVRACDQWVGAHVLDVDRRGRLSMLIADQGVPLGESSCVSCGTCVTVCPTGALFEKRCAHWQGRLPRQQTQTVCPSCGVGCRLSAAVRHRQISELACSGGPDGNRILCDRGRFGLVNPRFGRVTRIERKRGAAWTPAPLSEVLREVTQRLGAARVREQPSRAVALLSPRLPLETLCAWQSFMRDALGGGRWTLLDRQSVAGVHGVFNYTQASPPLAGIADLDDVDLYVLGGVKFANGHGVLGSYVRRAILHRGARLIQINPQHTWQMRWTDLHVATPHGRDAMVFSALLKYVLDIKHAPLDMPGDLADRLGKLTDGDVRSATGVPPEDLKAAARMIAEAQRPMFLVGRGITRQGPDPLRAVLNLVLALHARTREGRWRLMELANGGNSAGARFLGRPPLEWEEFDPHSADVAFVVLADDEDPWPAAWLKRLRAVSTVVVLTARGGEALDAAHFVVPTAAWAERAGTFVNLEGRVQKAARLMPPAEGCVDDVDFLRSLSKALHGVDAAWAPPELPHSLAHVAHDHRMPCTSTQVPVDFTGLEALAEA